MPSPSCLAAIMLALTLFSAAQAQDLKDVPKNHWARNAVIEVTRLGVMKAPTGRFEGSQRVSRTEFAIILANFARSLEKRSWPTSGKKTIKNPDIGKLAGTSPVTRYELAAAISLVARYAMAGLPKPHGKVYAQSEALPPPPKLSGIAPSHPAYTSLSYLAKKRMLFPNSVLLKPGSQPVTGQQVADGLAQVIAGLTDQWTDEPQNREMLEPPRSRHRR
jgi:hypothetical protein